MSDSIPWYCRILRCLGWTVEQEFQIMCKDHQGATREYTTGFLCRHDASMMCLKDQWVRRVITIWRD